MIAGRDDLLQHMNALLLRRSRVHTQLLSYDTTFNFGDFYLSVLLFRSVCFHENPVTPALFMLHERKLCSTHKRFVDVLCEKVPALNDSNCVHVTDGEPSFDVFEAAFPKLNKVFCWNHTLSAAKLWLHNHNASSAETQLYVDHIHTLLLSTNSASYQSEYREKVKLNFL